MVPSADIFAKPTLSTVSQGIGGLFLSAAAATAARSAKSDPAQNTDPAQNANPAQTTRPAQKTNLVQTIRRKGMSIPSLESALATISTVSK
jgi:hypothetical protein